MSVKIHFIMNLDTISPPFFHFKPSAVFWKLIFDFLYGLNN